MMPSHFFIFLVSQFIYCLLLSCALSTYYSTAQAAAQLHYSLHNFAASVLTYYSTAQVVAQLHYSLHNFAPK
jgi:fatty acid-binding protein DegV